MVLICRNEAIIILSNRIKRKARCGCRMSLFTHVGCVIGAVGQAGDGQCLCGGVMQKGLCVPSKLGTAVLFWSQVCPCCHCRCIVVILSTFFVFFLIFGVPCLIPSVFCC